MKEGAIGAHPCFFQQVGYARCLHNTHSENARLRVVPSLPTILIPQGEARECPVAGGQPKIVTAPSHL